MATAPGDDGRTGAAAAAVPSLPHASRSGPDAAAAVAAVTAPVLHPTTPGRSGAGGARRRAAVAARQQAARHATLAADARDHRRRGPGTDSVVRVRELHRPLHQPRGDWRTGPARPGAGRGLALRRARPARLPVVRAARPLVPGRPRARSGEPVPAAPLALAGAR